MADLSAAVATVAACVSALKDAKDGLEAALADRRKPVPEVTEALRIVGLVHARMLAVSEEIARVKEQLRNEADTERRLQQWLAERDQCRRDTLSGFPVLADASGALYCAACSEQQRRLVPLAKAPFDMPAYLCTGCRAVVPSS